MKTLIINSSNVISNSYNDTYTYKFPVGSVYFKNDQVGITSISIYYSWNNITSATTGGQYNNNSFSYIWIDGTTHTITLPDGYYEVSDINAYLQSQMVVNTHYMTATNGNFIYYLELVVNQTYYAVQLNCYNVPTTAQASSLGYSLPTTATWSLPATSKTPQFVISSSNNFQTVIGFSPGTYPSTTQSTTYNITSNNGVPQVTPVSSVIIACTLLNNTYSIPSTLLYSFSPNVSFGSQIQISPPQVSFVDIQDGTYNDFTIQFYDQNLNRIQILDDNIVVLLTIKNKNEYIEKTR
jgi:hypothetical protein